jgi:hypothetical protein
MIRIESSPSNLTELVPGLSSSLQRTLDEIQHLEADVSMRDEESDWEDTEDSNVPMGALTGEGDKVEVLLELFGVCVSCSSVFLNANTRVVDTDVESIIVLGANVFAVGRSNGRSRLTLSPMHILPRRPTRPIWKLTEPHLLWSM